jgi:hypothetical protein
MLVAAVFFTVSSHAQNPLEEQLLASDSRLTRTALKALHGLTVDEQRMLFTQFDSRLKADVWRQHLSEYLAEHGELNEEQKALIDSAKNLLDASLFDVRTDDPQWINRVREPLERLSERAAIVFDRNTVGFLFHRFSDRDEPIPVRERRQEFSVRSARIGTDTTGVPPSPHEDCECSKESDWCWSGSFCNNTYPTCRPVGFGCGTFFVYICDGMCVSPP